MLPGLHVIVKTQTLLQRVITECKTECKISKFERAARIIAGSHSERSSIRRYLFTPVFFKMTKKAQLRHWSSSSIFYRSPLRPLILDPSVSLKYNIAVCHRRARARKALKAYSRICIQQCKEQYRCSFLGSEKSWNQRKQADKRLCVGRSQELFKVSPSSLWTGLVSSCDDTYVDAIPKSTCMEPQSSMASIPRKSTICNHDAIDHHPQ